MCRYSVQLITAHNGVEVLIAANTAYVHTEFDDIISAWREQENKRKANARKKQVVAKFNPTSAIIKMIKRKVCIA